MPSTRRPRRLFRLARTVLVLALAAFVGGFVVFAASLGDMRVPSDPGADGIVVLTGGAARIGTGVELLSEGRAERLLISGVNRSVDREAVFALVDEDPQGPLACCIDIGREALDTAGNAREAQVWADAHGYRSLIVVTSEYHMARALAEFRAALPNVALTAYPVPNTLADVTSWWHDGPAFRLVAFEYLKLVGTLIRRNTAAVGGVTA